MDVRELAPSLLALGDLIQASNRILNRERASVLLQVKGEFKTGSFPVGLVVDQSLSIIDYAKELLLQYPQIKDAKDILEILFFYVGLPVSGALSVIKFLKWLKNRVPNQSQIVFNTESMAVTINLDGESKAVTKDVYDIAMSPQAREAIDRMVAPLKRPGIDTLDISETEDGEPVEQISKDDLGALTFEQLEGETLLDTTRDSVLAIIRLSFKPEHKWGFSDGSSKISAKILDFRFWDQIQRGEVKFSKGDQILVRLRTRSYRTPTGDLKSEHFVVEVVRHIARASQLPLLDLEHPKQPTR